MFSFIKKYAETMNGAGVYPKVAMFFFLIVFLAMLWFGLKADKKYIAELEQMPLDHPSSDNPQVNGSGHHQAQIPGSKKA